MQTESLIHCPHCGFEKLETMPLDSCQIRYLCSNCQTLLKPKSGDCCVFCSYGTVPCPSIQQENSQHSSEAEQKRRGK
jgi:hypothetical protein